MAYYKPCPNCGANLDPGEICDCKDREKKEERKIIIPARISAMNDAARKLKPAAGWN